ncbi:unnamed protein product [Rhizophagus irregularis]|nr:unnamed protein product [Rhizophagus irregularis]
MKLLNKLQYISKDIEELKDITMLENTDDQLSIIDKEYPNSKNTCDKVRKYLQEKCMIIKIFIFKQKQLQ